MVSSSGTSRPTKKASTTRTASRRGSAPTTRPSAKTAAVAAPRGHNSIAVDLTTIFVAARPLVERWLDISDDFSALRDEATAKGIDWSQVKALLKAQVQDERSGNTRHVARIVEKADYASSYAKLLGLGGNLNEKKIFREDPQSTVGESLAAAESTMGNPATHLQPPGSTRPARDPVIVETGNAANGSVGVQPPTFADLDIPEFMRRSAETS